MGFNEKLIFQSLNKKGVIVDKWITVWTTQCGKVVGKMCRVENDDAPTCPSIGASLVCHSASISNTSPLSAARVTFLRIIWRNRPDASPFSIFRLAIVLGADFTAL